MHWRVLKMRRTFAFDEMATYIKPSTTEYMVRKSDVEVKFSPFNIILTIQPYGMDMAVELSLKNIVRELLKYGKKKRRAFL